MDYKSRQYFLNYQILQIEEIEPPGDADVQNIQLVFGHGGSLSRIVIDSSTLMVQHRVQADVPVEPARIIFHAQTA